MNFPVLAHIVRQRTRGGDREKGKRRQKDREQGTGSGKWERGEREPRQDRERGTERG